MTLRARFTLVKRNLLEGRRHLAFASVGLIVGTATLVFFLALAKGVREGVVNRLYPVNQVELQPEIVRLLGLGIEVPSRLDRATIEAIKSLPGVVAVYPKQRSKFQAKLWGGEEIFGYRIHVEAFFDGLEPSLIREELAETEARVLGPADLDKACLVDSDCGKQGFCKEGRCYRPTYYSSFDDLGDVTGCQSDKDCLPGERCKERLCVPTCASGTQCPKGLECVSSLCLATCKRDEDCKPGEVCDEGGHCRRLQCRLQSPKDQYSSNPLVLRGRIKGSDKPCPEGTYCATPNVLESEGFCTAPIPVILSPFLMEVYNSVAATALGLRRLSGLEVALGITFTMLFGESFFVEDERVEKRVIRRARIVGFSPKAMEFGVTMPLQYAKRANAALRGRSEAESYTSLIVETRRNEDIPALVDDAKVLGLTLAPRSEEARKAANVLTVFTIVFSMISVVILAISAINITHTFLMLVSERRMEIAIYRAVGATLWDIRLLVLLEAAVLGLFGSLMGIFGGVILSRVANIVLSSVLETIPSSPKDIFLFSPWIVLLAAFLGVSFALLGAYVPARRAAGTDPATVLTQG